MTLVISKIFEYISHFCFFTPLQILINKAYVKLFNISLDEFDSIESYRSLNSLFIRSLVREREFLEDLSVLISPSDGLITEVGKCTNNKALQIKGKEYVVSDFLDKSIGDDYEFINIYLSPSNYHRFHAPTNLIVKKVRFIKGALYPVNNFALKNVENLFTKNKRVVLECVDCYGNEFFIVAIGALNVGRIQIHITPELIDKKDSCVIVLDDIRINKGDEIGYFEMGSTIVMITKGWNYNVESGNKVLFGNDIGVSHDTGNKES